VHKQKNGHRPASRLASVRRFMDRTTTLSFYHIRIFSVKYELYISIFIVSWPMAIKHIDIVAVYGIVETLANFLAGGDC